MTIWVDADGLPVKIRNIVVKAAHRTGIPAVFVADRPLPLEETDKISHVVVEEGEDSADSYIRESCREGDIAISRDVLFSRDVVEKGVLVLDDRGGVYTRENIRERVSNREIMREFREMGLNPEDDRKNFGEKEVRLFAAALDRILNRILR